MPAEPISLSGPVEVTSSSAEMAALELMKHIASREVDKTHPKDKRGYWLTLYRQCYKATTGHSLESILKHS